jgi:hypothetical protein
VELTAADFLRELWGERPPGHIQVWELDGRRSFYPRSIDAAAAIADGATDVYTGVALAGQNHGRYNRAKANQAVAIAGLWLDIDVDGGPDNKTGGAPDLDQAVWLAHQVAAPTLIVHSGYGAHAWWLFDEPWHFKNMGDQAAAADAAARWQALHRSAAIERGFSIDHTHDLARLLRIPGTFNGKGAAKVPVTVVRHDGHRHGRAGLLAQAAKGAIDTQLTMGPAGDLPVVDVGQGRALAAPVLEALLENSPEFKRTWLHARSEEWSMSEYDLALCSIAAQAEGITDQHLADLIAQHRRVWKSPEKGERLDYVRRTVAKARQSASRSKDIDWFKSRARAGQVAA